MMILDLINQQMSLFCATVWLIKIRSIISVPDYNEEVDDENVENHMPL
jgi:hypothetical protein